MEDAPDVGGDDGLRAFPGEIREFSIAQLERQFGLQDRIGAGGSAAQIRFVGRNPHIETQPGEFGFHAAAQPLSVLQRAGGVVCLLYTSRCV